LTVVKTTFHQRLDERGALSFLEAKRDIPFAVKRIYYIYAPSEGTRRGFHAHKALRQYMICVHGQCKVLLDDGKDREVVVMDDPTEGLYVGPMFWHEMYDFSKDAVLLVLASEYYDDADYIRDYKEFLTYWRGENVQ